jgi:hypothetical protein
MVPYQSRLLRYVATMTYALPLVAGWMAEATTLHVPVLDLVYDHPDAVRLRPSHALLGRDPPTQPHTLLHTIHAHGSVALLMSHGDGRRRRQ